MTHESEVELGQVRTELASWRKKTEDLDVRTSDLQAELNAARGAQAEGQREREHLVKELQECRDRSVPADGASSTQGGELRDEILRLEKANAELLSGVQGRAQEIEPNESMSEATVIPTGKPVRGTVGGPKGNADWFKIIAPRDGKVIGIVANIGGTGRVFGADCVGADGNVIGWTQPGNAGPGAQSSSNGGAFAVAEGQITYWKVVSHDAAKIVEYTFELRYTD